MPKESTAKTPWPVAMANRPDDYYLASHGDGEGNIEGYIEGDAIESQASELSAGGGKRRSKRHYQLADEDEEVAVIEWVQSVPMLWNRKDKEFKNKSKKDRVWEEKAQELGYEVKLLRTWYTDLRDFNTKLMKQKSTDSTRQLTDREKWVMDKFSFLRSTVRHNRPSIKRTRETIMRTRRDLAKAKRIAAAGKKRLTHVDTDPDSEQDESFPAASFKKSKRCKDDGDPLIQSIQRRIDAAQTELATVRQALTSEPVTERTAFLEWVKTVCRDATEDQWFEFQTTFTNLFAKWKVEDRQLQQQQEMQAFFPQPTLIRPSSTPPNPDPSP
ncbi:uncharacterized protein [Diadema setosum]|uniref:uncharacterized protein n=1 Tax=Diadema setosum TaxID=31175 RepID=UPI003B3A37A5